MFSESGNTRGLSEVTLANIKHFERMTGHEKAHKKRQENPKRR